MSEINICVYKFVKPHYKYLGNTVFNTKSVTKSPVKKNLFVPLCDEITFFTLLAIRDLKTEEILRCFIQNANHNRSPRYLKSLVRILEENKARSFAINFLFKLSDSHDFLSLNCRMLLQFPSIIRQCYWNIDFAVKS